MNNYIRKNILPRKKLKNLNLPFTMKYRSPVTKELTYFTIMNHGNSSCKVKVGFQDEPIYYENKITFSEVKTRIYSLERKLSETDDSRPIKKT